MVSSCWDQRTVVQAATQGFGPLLNAATGVNQIDALWHELLCCVNGVIGWNKGLPDVPARACPFSLVMSADRMGQ
jgi:hypothetical protein